MGFQFNKSIKILPGVKMNLSFSGISFTLGQKGANINVSKNGIKSTLGIPGSGLTYKKKIL